MLRREVILLAQNKQGECQAAGWGSFAFSRAGGAARGLCDYANSVAFGDAAGSIVQRVID
jgi:hypothetical protein